MLENGSTFLENPGSNEVKGKNRVEKKGEK